MDVPDRPKSPETLRITALLVEIVDVVRTIAAPLGEQVAALAAVDSSDARTARRVIGELAEVMAWHVECLNEYIESLDDAAEPKPARAISRDASNRTSATSRQLFTDSEALDRLSRAYDALRDEALHAGDAGTALVARQGIAEIAPLWAQLTALVPVFVAAEFRALTRTLE